MTSMTIQEIENYYSTGFFSEIDIHFARFVSRLSGDGNPALFLAAALVSKFTSTGHICLDLSDAADCLMTEQEHVQRSLVCPKLVPWINALRVSPAVGSPGEFKPLILDDSSRLYLHRYWEYEQKLAQALRLRSCYSEIPVDKQTLKEGLDRYFPNEMSNEIDWKKLAAFTAVVKKLAVICGGPGTGKTTTIAKILGLLIEQASEGYRIALTAPTGKAADRLQKAIQKTKENLPCSKMTMSAIPDTASTLHRLLGSLPGSVYVRYNSEAPLPLDVVVVDEASMVDLPLMSKLFQAVLPETKIILFGDKDQLASVESGAVFREVCSRERIEKFSAHFLQSYRESAKEKIGFASHTNSRSVLADCIVELKENYRFGCDSGIGRISNMVNAGDGDAALFLLKSNHYADVEWSQLPKYASLAKHLQNIILNRFGRYVKASSFKEAMMLFEQFRVVCALRDGPYGVKALNAVVEKILADRSLIKPSTPWYHGRPIMITRNDYNLKLFNGDVGIAFLDPGNPVNLQAYFPGPDGSMRLFPPVYLPEVETVYAMTVHKSQGSEFDEMVLILPDQASPVLTRELIYTAITRVRKKVWVWGSEDVFRSAVDRFIKRTSGLRDALYD